MPVVAGVPQLLEVSSYIGDAWQIDSPTLLPPPPLRSFVEGLVFRTWTSDGLEQDACDEGEVDARACVHCRTLTHHHHTPLVVQTNLKSPPPPFIEEIQREMRVVLQKATHIVLMGYSLPPDDFTYRAFLAARTRRAHDLDVRCSVVDKRPGFTRRWLYPDELDSRGDLPRVVRSAQALFGTKNVRFYGAGIPDVFLDDGGNVTESSVERLLVW